MRRAERRAALLRKLSDLALIPKNEPQARCLLVQRGSNGKYASGYLAAESDQGRRRFGNLREH